ncbi:hypothetical protein T03_10312, partial [Trichinella britovi]
LIELFKEPIQGLLADDQLLRFFSCSSRHHCSSRSIHRSLALESGSEDQMLATTICQLAVDCNFNDLQARSSDRLTAKPMSWSIQAKQSQVYTQTLL